MVDQERTSTRPAALTVFDWAIIAFAPFLGGRGVWDLLGLPGSTDAVTGGLFLALSGILGVPAGLRLRARYRRR